MTDTITLHELLQFLRDKGLVGEEKLGLCLAVSMPWGGFTMLLGPSSTGKTYTFERACEPYMDEHGNSPYIYEVSTSTSPKALFYDADKWNAKPIHVWPDLASMNESHESIAKAIGEGKPADHSLADVVSDGIKNKKLNPGRTDVILLASDNEGTDRNDFSEVRNRARMFFTDASSNTTQLVVQRRADEKAGLIEYNLSDADYQRIRSHADRVMRFAGTFQAQDGSFFNPVIPEITSRQVIPSLWPEARRDIDKLMRMMDAVALWSHPTPDYMKDGKPVIMVRPSDVWLAMKIFGESMVMSALNISTEDVAIISLLREKKSAMSVSKIKQLLADPDGPGINIPNKLVRQQLEALDDRGYVTKDAQSSPVTYRAGLFAKQVERSTRLDWNEVLDKTIENMNRTTVVPDTAKETYVASYCQNPTEIQPFTGETVAIREDDTFSGELAEAAQQYEEAVSKPMWESPAPPSAPEEDDSDESASSESGGGQVTLT